MALIVSLSGNNYVSEKTKTAFEAALQDGQRVKSNGNGNGKGNGSHPVTTDTVAANRPAPEPRRTPVVPAALPMPPVAMWPTPTASPPPDYSRLLETVERGLAQSFDHQNLTLRVHEKYLNHQSDYAKIFSQLMEQQGAIFTNGNATPQQAASAAQVLESLSSSMARFHDIQSETLGVHKQFLSQQAEYSRTYIELLQQHGTLSNSGGNGGHPVTAKPVPQAHAVAETLKPVLVAAPGPVAAAPATSPVITTPVPTAKTVPKTVPAIELPAAPVAAPSAPVSPRAPSTSAVDVTTLTQSLLGVVSEKTGYPAEMLELSMDMEADLGIDSIKRVEILGGLQDLHPELPEFSTDVLAELRTLGQIVEYMGGQVSADAAPVAVETPSATVFAPVEAAAPASGVDVAVLTKSLLGVVSEKTGYPAEMLELSMDMEADLGIDSIKRVEILGGLQDLHPELPEFSADVLAELRTLGQIVEYMGGQVSADAAPVAVETPSATVFAPVEAAAPASGVDVAVLTKSLLGVVSEKTGYPAEMLELSMDMEADLGIDSIKRVEILGGLQDLHPELPEFSADVLAELRTLGQIVEYMGAQTATDGKKKALVEEPVSQSSIQRREVGLRVLPAPDSLEFALPQDRACLVVDDGTPASAGLAQTLAARDWNVTLLRLPASLNPVPQPVNDRVRQVVLDELSEAHLQAQLAAVGLVGCFIHVNPPADTIFSDAEKARLKLAFLVAKHLKSSLADAARDGRACFITVTRMDGALGLGQAGAYAAVDGGFGGLTKTLSLEWPGVFCRAVDVSPQFDAVQTVQAILAELHDPNRLLVEVGHGEHGRVTLEVSRR